MYEIIIENETNFTCFVCCLQIFQVFLHEIIVNGWQRYRFFKYLSLTPLVNWTDTFRKNERSIQCLTKERTLSEDYFFKRFFRWVLRNDLKKVWTCLAWNLKSDPFRLEETFSMNEPSKHKKFEFWTYPKLDKVT